MRISIFLALSFLTACQQPVPVPLLQDVAKEAGLHFVHDSGAKGSFYLPEIMGSGVALADFDQDGDVDVLLIQGAVGSSQRYFRNELRPGGRLAFTDRTREAGLEREAVGMGAAVGDVDNDGKPDLLVTAFGRNALYRNKGDGTFTVLTNEEVALAGRWSTSAAFVDYDRDGWQDLVILEYIDYSVAANKKCYAPTGELDYCTPRVYRPVPAHLFHNDRGRLREVPNAFAAALGPGLGVTVLDADDDGWPDLFVANDSMANHLWINQRNGSFLEKALEFGVAYGEEGLAKAGMGVAAGDYDHDGREDLLVLNLMREGASLFHSMRAGLYADVSLKTGIHAATFQATGFGAGWADFDLDGHLDAFLANGAVTRREEQRGQPYPFAEHNLVLRRQLGGRFQAERVGEAAVSRGAAFGDLDRDGDVDVVVNVNHGPARLLLANPPAGRGWLAVEGAPGEQVRVEADGLPAQLRVIRSAFSYLSASESAAYFGLARSRQVSMNGRKFTSNRRVAR